jgi:hypothetical protein
MTEFTDSDLRSFAGPAIYPLGSVPNRLAAEVIRLQAENTKLRKCLARYDAIVKEYPPQ